MAARLTWRAFVPTGSHRTDFSHGARPARLTCVNAAPKPSAKMKYVSRATGATARAALRAIRRAGPKRLVLAAAVAPRTTIETLRAECDEVVCVATPDDFGAISAFYADFHQVSDDEVIDLLRRAHEIGTAERSRADDRRPSSV